jgi:hypothetical protein
MRRTRSKTHPAASLPRTDRRIQEHEADSYGSKGKLPDPTACPECRALYRDGRWTWGSPPVDAHPSKCPACRRIEDRLPAGIVVVEGEFAQTHRAELEGRIRHVEERERAEHPLKRIIAIEDRDTGGFEVSTTDARLARGIGAALHAAYQGEVEYRFAEADGLTRVYWRR